MTDDAVAGHVHGAEPAQQPHRIQVIIGKVFHKESSSGNGRRPTSLAFRQLGGLASG
ncbi:MAG: hypothetical protein WDO74_02050 [Pseudomonadota bacterium]